MKKRYKLLAIIYFIIVAVILLKYNDLSNLAMDTVNDLNYVKCGSAEHIPKPLPQLTSIGYTLVTVGTPIILIIFSIITLVKASTSGTADEIVKAKTNLFKKFVIAAVIFFIGAFVQFLLLRLTSNDEDTRTATECLKCFLYYSTNNCQVSDSGFKDSSDRYKTSNIPYYLNSNMIQTSNRIANNGGNNIYSGAGNIILVGDSRTAQICGYTDGAMHSGEKCRDYISVAQGGKNAIWFRDEAVPAVSIIVNGNATKKFNIIILMGANDVGAVTGKEAGAVNIYKNQLPKLAQETWKDQIITFVKLPCGDREMAKKNNMVISQPQIDSFNKQMKEFIESQNISNLRYCEIEDVPSKYLSDGVHYTSEGSNFYYEQIKNKCV